VPSTGDLLGAAVPGGLAAEARRAATDFSYKLEEYTPLSSPRSDASDRGVRELEK